MTITATAAPARGLLAPGDHLLIMIDHQSQMAFAAKTMDIKLLQENVALVARAAKAFGTPTILTTVAAKTFSGPLFSELTAAMPSAQAIDRTTMNAWEDVAVIARVNAAGLGRIVIAGLWTSVCVVGPVLSALEQGFEVYFIADACADTSEEANERSIARMIQAGARPMTALQYLLELQRDWARQDSYEATTSIAEAHGGAYGVGIAYAAAMLGASEATG
jgi:nicotinamidase-related amidase